MKSKSDSQAEQIWEDGFSGHSDAQLLRLARLPFAEKLKWLDEMHAFLNTLNAAENDRSDSGEPHQDTSVP